VAAHQASGASRRRGESQAESCRQSARWCHGATQQPLPLLKESRSSVEAAQGCGDSICVERMFLGSNSKAEMMLGKFILAMILTYFSSSYLCFFSVLKNPIGRDYVLITCKNSEN
jgi:hypothetical protein